MTAVTGNPNVPGERGEKDHYWPGSFAGWIWWWEFLLEGHETASGFILSATVAAVL